MTQRGSKVFILYRIRLVPCHASNAQLFVTARRSRGSLKVRAAVTFRSPRLFEAHREPRAFSASQWLAGWHMMDDTMPVNYSLNTYLLRFPSCPSSPRLIWGNFLPTRWYIDVFQNITYYTPRNPSEEYLKHESFQRAETPWTGEEANYQKLCWHNCRQYIFK